MSVLKQQQRAERTAWLKSPLPLAQWCEQLGTTAFSPPAAGSKRPRLPPVIVSCALCAKTRTLPACELTKALRRGHKDFYCSEACSRAHHAVKNRRLCRICQLPTPKKSMGYHDACRVRVPPTPAAYPPKEANCATCHGLFTALWRGKSAGKYAAYCNKRCSEIGHSQRMVGRGNPKWKHGASLARQQPHSAKAYREMRRRALARDLNSCVLCGAADKRLEVHHIDEDPTNNSLINLVTLCSAHHRDAHRTLASPKMWSPQLSWYTVM